jgi:hypothetical protein
MTLRRVEFSSSFCSANFTVIPTRYTSASKMATNKLEHDEKRAVKGTKKERI